MPESFGRAAYELPPWILNLTIDDAVKLILLSFYGATPPGPGGGGGGGIVVGTPTGTPAVPVFMGASEDNSIPVGAKFWSISVISGTVSIDSTALIPAGFSYNGDYQTTSPIAVSTASGSSAILTWAT